MREYTLFTHPMSRGQIARWALHEANADYEHVLVDWSNKPPALLRANPMGKVPTLIHHLAGEDRVVSEAAAICTYLADINPSAGLLPGDEEKASYYRWMFFAAGPGEQAIAAKSFGFDPHEPQQQGTAGWGSLDRVVRNFDWWLTDRAHVCGDRFTMADVYVGSQIEWGMNFGIFPPTAAFVAYTDRLQARDAYKTAKAIDNKLIEGMKK